MFPSRFVKTRSNPAARTILIAAMALGMACAADSRVLLRESTAAAVPLSIHSDSHDPWTASEIVEPADLAKEISTAPSASRPIVVCVGMRTYFKTAHVPGAVLHGPAMSPAGLAHLKKWAEKLPRSGNLVVYCGCCPLAGCPNLRPGFQALRDMGFRHLRVLTVPNSFGVDWVEKGYPVEHGE